MLIGFIKLSDNRNIYKQFQKVCFLTIRVNCLCFIYYYVCDVLDICLFVGSFHWCVLYFVVFWCDLCFELSDNLFFDKM